ncbi:MAG: hypothetical protein J6X43_04995 [Bacteroidales bacterium]|jgi:hypothetical protein|nr:hypothetical protein [Bacteroidales bacterium]
MKKEINIRFILAAVVVAFGILLIVAGFIVPPTGVIDASVLTAFGEALTFAGSVLGIDTSYRKKKLDIQRKEEVCED